ncbi:N-acetylmuramoyl-L-alanine amidase [Pseudomonas capsici]|uniref:N-acetylmuramoyl-L-alanine amidase n=1 Tax=Pseudomonas capsici TaxID=2810614 RepID=A0ABT3BW33_9PSED|nr:N-acetylmuramoyl-L-alanine amidase [Pseudomonas capsici]MCV4268237.1 N-acetylmuramoyl-L-alanine amidase [Pseudomonas capsici]MCV4278710.1 N-acetylmuramoyl-L-alanine amidase [Pseudomonas capsici]MCV4331942.1 N-acetylmuramoyl-L-alanine amidase [Pseudomonas capsici]MCV4377040.1 N-acetylmuramoyl-L-alanine amidase [Pseudomonas capsici]
MNPNTSPVLKERDSTDLIVVHCSATRANADIGVRDITQWHIQRGFDTVGYHYVIRRNGELETGRAENTIGAHVRGHNSNSIGVCLAGGVDTNNKPENNFTAAQFATLETLLGQLKGRYPTAQILGHRDLSPDRNGDGKITPNEFIKACPSFDVREWLAGRNSAL